MALATEELTGSYTEADYVDFAHTGPGTLAGRYMRLFWHPICQADDLPPGRAKPIRILSQDLTLYRGESGTPYLVDFRCAHRGTQLSTGWVEEDTIRCFYHGWRYDGTGQCIEQPAEPNPFCEKVRIRSYPAEEYLGTIFVYLGEGDPAPMPRYPELEREGVLDVYTRISPSNYFNHIELDAIHNVFAHHRGVRVPLPKESWVEETEWGLAEYAERTDGDIKINQWGMPNIRLLRETIGGGFTGYKPTLHWVVPIDDAGSVEVNISLIPLTGEDAREYKNNPPSHAAKSGLDTLDNLRAILAGDIRVQDLYAHSDQPDSIKGFNPIEHDICQTGQGTIADRQHECLGASDASVILIRRLWEQEMRALAEGRPLRTWTYSERLLTSNGRPQTKAPEPPPPSLAARLRWA